MSLFVQTTPLQLLTKCNSKMSDESKEIADAFNNCFANAGPGTEKDVPMYP